MPEIHLKQPASLNKSDFTYSACGPFTKNKERIEKSLCKLEIEILFIKMNLIQLAFSMI